MFKISMTETYKKCLGFRDLNFGFVSDFDIRISNFILFKSGFIYFHPRGSIDGLAGQGIQFVLEELVWVFPKTRSPAATGTVT